MTKDLDPRSLREGDKITVEMTVGSVASLWINTTSNNVLDFSNFDDGHLRLISIERAPREFAVGDEVTWGSGVQAWEVLAIDDGVAWVKRAEMRRDVLIGSLRHV
jgi:hypothetical protein